MSRITVWRIILLCQLFLISQPMVRSTFSTSRTLLDFINFCQYERAGTLEISLHYTQTNTKNNLLDLQAILWHAINGSMKIITTLNTPTPMQLAINYHILMLDTYEALDGMVAPSKNNKTTSHQDFFLVIWDMSIRQDDIHKAQNHTLQLFMDYFWEKQILNVIIMVPNKDDVSSLFTYTPFSENYCQKARLVSLQGSLPVPNFFPVVLTNWHMCNLTVGTFHIPPFIILRKGFPTYGLEWNMLETIAMKLNATLRAKMEPIDDKFGQVFSNGTYKGIARLLHEHKVHLAVGVLVRKARLVHVFAMSERYLQTRYQMFYIPVREPHNAYELLIYPFHWPVWLSLFITVKLILILLRIHLADAWIGWINLFERIWLVLLGMSTIFSNQWSLRYMLMLLSMMMLVLRSGYQGVMFYLFSELKELNFQVYKDLHANNYTMVLTEYIIQRLDKLPKTFTLPLVIEHNRITSLATLEEHPDRRFVTLSTRSFADDYYATHKKFPKTVGKHLFFPVDQSTIYYPKHSFIAQRINRLINLIFDTGLYNKYENDFNTFLRKYSSRRSVDELRGISLQQLKQVFIAQAFLWLLASAILVGEILWHRRKQQRTAQLQSRPSRNPGTIYAWAR